MTVAAGVAGVTETGRGMIAAVVVVVAATSTVEAAMSTGEAAMSTAVAVMNIAAVVMIGTGPLSVAVLGALAATMNGVAGGASRCLRLRPLLPLSQAGSSVQVSGWYYAS